MNFYSELRSFYYGVRKLRVLQRKLNPENPDFSLLKRYEIDNYYSDFRRVRDDTYKHLQNILTYMIDNSFVPDEYLERK